VPSSSNDRRATGSRKARTPRFLLSIAAVFALIAGTAFMATPANAAPPEGALTINKTVEGQESVQKAPGDEFDYTITVGCDDNDCLSAQMTDPLPAEFAGFTILGTTVSPNSQPSSFSYAGCTTTVTADCQLTVLFQSSLGGGNVGIPAGVTYQVVVALKVPQNLPPTWPSNGIAVTNTATATSTTAATVSDGADVTVSIPITVDTVVAKTWTPPAQQFLPGAPSAITLSSQNTSNVPADSLQITDPTSAIDGATGLGADNPFNLVDFNGFGAVSMPDGADLVTVDAYVDNGDGTYVWKPGSPRAPGAIQLPDLVTNADVLGLRITFTSSTGATIAPSGAAGAVVLNALQRSTNRTSGDSLASGASVTNQMSGTVTVPQQDPVTKTATAPYSVGALNVQVAAAKSISPDRIPGGTTTTATITGTNTSNGTLDNLSLSDTNFFTAKLQFGGFSAPLIYPQGTGATGSAVITWFFSDGTQQTDGFANGDTPTAPAAAAGEHLTGFAIAYAGQIASGAEATAKYLIAPTSDFATVGSNPTVATNTVNVDGTNVVGPAHASASKDLDVFVPDISLQISKNISPSSSVSPGATVVAQLPTTTSVESAFVNPDKIVVQDVWDPADTTDDFLDAFNPIAIAPTQVLAGSKMLIEYTTDNGATWTTFTTVDATGGTQVYSGNLPAGLTSTITGLRFTFTQAGMAAFPQGTSVSPNIVYQARSTLRSNGQPTSVADAGPTSYTNLAAAQGSGSVQGIPLVQSPTVVATDDAQIETHSGGIGTLIANKAWRTPDFSGDLTSLVSQSGATAGTTLGWGVTDTGYSEATIADPSTDAEAAAPADSVFQAFDLKQIAPITFSQDPLLKWDTVSQVWLYEGGWQQVTPPAGGWMGANGFVGHVLTGSESQNATGVKVVVTPNDTARANSTDPLAPPVGSGVATSPNGSGRPINLVWQLRNVVRDTASQPSYPWVSATHGYNTVDPSVIDNTVGVSGVQNSTPVGPRVADDTVSLQDLAPAVDVSKSTEKTQIVVPKPGDVPPGDYMTNDFTINAKINSASRASYVRVSDPMPCQAGDVASCVTPASAWGTDPYATATYDPSVNPFERFTLTGIAFTVNTAQVNTAQSQVTLWIRNGEGIFTTQTMSIDAAQALTAPDLVNVVGVSVLYQGTDPATNGGLIGNDSTMQMVLHTQLRSELRSQPGTFVTPTDVTNYTFSQSYDPVLFPSGQQSTPSDSDNKTVTLINGQLGVTAAKSFSVGTILEKDRANPLSVTLNATQGNQTVATNVVTVQDTEQTFWDDFALTGAGLGTVTLPAGSDQVQVSVQQNGGSTWVDGPVGATAVLPNVPLDSVTGIRFTFSRADGGLFSHSAVPAPWTTSMQLPIVLRAANRTTGDPIPFPSSVHNVVSSTSHRTDSPVLYPDATANGPADIQLDPGTFKLDVSKDPQSGIHTVTPGDPNQWTMKFTNTGTGFLTVNDFVDQLPTTLAWDGITPTYTTSSGGTLSTSPTASFDQGTNTMTFTWPSGGQTMAPQESFMINMGITLNPGLMANQRATNQFIVDTAQTLSACTNLSNNGQGVLSGLSSTQCGTSNYVQPIPGASLLSTKSVKGAQPGGVNETTPGGPCLVDLEGFYKSPCAANTIVGGTDIWKLDAVNSGTVSYNQLTIVDPLPYNGDRLLATGASRGSTYQPVFDGASGLQFTNVPAGATTSWQVTTSPNVCVGTGSGSTWPADPTCANQPTAANWTSGPDYTGDWADVTGIRAVVDFSTTTAHVLAPGGAIQLRYQTINEPATAADPALAPVTVPIADGAAIAWNQVGAVAALTGGGTLSRAPVKAGVVMTSGSLEVTKKITGAAAQYAPTSFQADVACTIAGADVDMGGFGTVTLDQGNAYTARIDGIPLGASCTITEHGDTGSYGESSRTYQVGTDDPTTTPAVVTIDTPNTSTDPVPPTRIATITNDYAVGSLSISKTVDTLATVGTFGPFSYSLTCTSQQGDPITLNPADASFTLNDGDTHVVNDIPVLADCVVTETNSDHADGVSVKVDNDDPTSGAVANVTIAANGNTAAYTNTYLAGTLSIKKTITGAGAGEGTGAPGPDDGYGQGPFTVAVQCTYDGQTLYDDSVQVLANATTDLTPLFPMGTVCSIEETVNGGANSTDNVPSVIIAGPQGQDVVGATTVDVTNTFNQGSVHVTKVRDGAGADVYGAGPFTAQVVCTWQKDGQTLTIPLPDAGVVELNEGNGYEATITGLIQGASCVTTETVTGGASTVTYDPPADPSDPTQSGAAIVPNGDAAQVTITNTFDTGDLSIVKNRAGDGVDAFGAGPFTVQVVCTYEKDGVVTPIDLGDDAQIQLTKDNGYAATVAGIIAGADCQVTETDKGLAVSSTSDPEDGHVIIKATGDADGPATVTITNTFLIGQLTLDKTVDKTSAVVGDTLVYTITLKNTGEIEAHDLTVTDNLPSSLTVVSTDPPATTTKIGSLAWNVNTLAIGATRVFHVTTTVTTAGSVANGATVTNPSGPWSGVESETTCNSEPGGACASITVSEPQLPGDGGLANTGFVVTTGLAIGGAALAAGILLFVFVRRRRA
jgi:uncharacterized repeat protein (TIGR01451 family)